MRAELSGKEGCVTVRGILHPRRLRAGRHLPRHHNTGRVETEGKKVLEQFQRPPTQLRPTLDRLGTDNSTDSGGPNEAVYQGFDPIPAIHIIPRC